MTVDVGGSRPISTAVRPGPAAVPDRRDPAATRRRPSVRRGRFLGVRTGQLVSTQLSAALLLLGAGGGTLALTSTAVLAAMLFAVTWLPLHRRWAFEWIATAARYASRPHAVGPGDPPAALLQLVAPGALVRPAELAGDHASVIVDSYGITAVLELGDPTGLLVEPLPALPPPAALLPAAGPDHPPCQLQLLLSAAPAPAVRAGGGTPANSYRQLTEGRLLGHSRTLLAVRVLRAEGWPEEDLLRSLSGIVRKLPRRLGEVPARPLGEAAVVRAISDLAHADDADPARETWPGLRGGGLTQATFRLRRWPDSRIESAHRLVRPMLALPAAATTVSLTVGPRSPGGTGAVAVDVTVRLAAADETELEVATQALRKLLDSEHASARRLDGEHLDGLATTLPLGGPAAPAVPGRFANEARPLDLLDGFDLPLGSAGLMLGNNRHGAPVIARLFRPEQTRALLVGGVRGAQLVALRAMALGARVVVQTARPQAWEPFVRGAAVPGESIAVVAPGRVLQVPPGTALHPLLVVVDVGPVGPDTRPGNGWQATLVVRDDFTPADVDVASRADLLVLQPLRADEAALIGSALGLGDATQWLTRIRADMIGLVNRRSVRWATLSTTPIENQLIGSPARG